MEELPRVVCPLCEGNGEIIASSKKHHANTKKYTKVNGDTCLGNSKHYGIFPLGTQPLGTRTNNTNSIHHQQICRSTIQVSY